MTIRRAVSSDKKAIINLHRDVARLCQGIARIETELTEAYADELFHTVAGQGLMLVALDAANHVVAEIHGSKCGLHIFDHVLMGLTIAVHPEFQGQGIGKMLFRAFLDDVQRTFPEVSLVELESRSSNQKSLGLYHSMGFVLEGRMKNKTRNQDGSFEDSLLMAWYK